MDHEFLSLMALAVAPAVAIAIGIHFYEKFDREPFILLVISFLLGSLMAAPAILLELGIERILNNLQANMALYAFVGIALVEEGLKFAVIRFYAYPKRDFSEPYDGITYSVMVSMGFAAIENVIYALQFGHEVALLRMFTAVPAHGTFGILMGFYLGKAKFGNQPLLWSLVALSVAVLFHGAYDYFLMITQPQGIYWGAFASLVVGIVLSIRATRIHKRRKSKL